MLMNHRNTLISSVSGALNDSFGAFPQNHAAMRLVDSGQDFDQRTFASPVFAGQRMDSAFEKLKVNAAQDLDWPEALRYPAEFDCRNHSKLFAPVNY